MPLSSNNFRTSATNSAGASEERDFPATPPYFTIQTPHPNFEQLFLS